MSLLLRRPLTSVISVPMGFRSDPINQKVYFGDFGPCRVKQEQEAARDSGWGYTLIYKFLRVQNI